MLANKGNPIIIQLCDHRERRWPSGPSTLHVKTVGRTYSKRSPKEILVARNSRDIERYGKPSAVVVLTKPTSKRKAVNLAKRFKVMVVASRETTAVFHTYVVAHSIAEQLYRGVDALAACRAALKSTNKVWSGLRLHGARYNPRNLKRFETSGNRDGDVAIEIAAPSGASAAITLPERLALVLVGAMIALASFAVMIA